MGPCMGERHELNLKYFNKLLSHFRSLVCLRIDGNQLMHFIPWRACLRLFANALDRNSFVADNAVILQDSQDVHCICENKKREINFNSTSACSDYCADSLSGQSNIILSNGYIPLMITLLAIICHFVGTAMQGH